MRQSSKTISISNAAHKLSIQIPDNNFSYDNEDDEYYPNEDAQEIVQSYQNQNKYEIENKDQ